MKTSKQGKLIVVIAIIILSILYIWNPTFGVQIKKVEDKSLGTVSNVTLMNKAMYKAHLTGNGTDTKKLKDLSVDRFDGFMPAIDNEVIEAAVITTLDDDELLLPINKTVKEYRKDPIYLNGELKLVNREELSYYSFKQFFQLKFTKEKVYGSNMEELFNKNKRKPIARDYKYKNRGDFISIKGEKSKDVAEYQTNSHYIGIDVEYDLKHNETVFIKNGEIVRGENK